MGGMRVHRPLISLPKQALYEYALKHRLEWVEDATNASNVYLRNRVRAKAYRYPVAAKQRVLALRDRQMVLRRDIRRLSERLVVTFNGSRHALTVIDPAVACELLGMMIEQQGATRPTHPQLERALLAIKTARPGTKHDVGAGISLEFTARKFSIKVV